MCVCLHQCFPSSHVYFYVVCFWIPPHRAFHPWTTRQSGVLWGLQRDRGEERDVGTPRKSKREPEKREGRQGEEKKSFERLLTSKLTVIAVLARGESTFKHTGWVTMWRDYKSKVIHNKQSLLGSALPANLHEIGVEKKIKKCLKGQRRPRIKGDSPSPPCTRAVIRFTKCEQDCWMAMLALTRAFP